MRFSKRVTNISAKYLFTALFFFSIFVFLGHTFITKTAIFADGRFYYAITRSLIKDDDIKFGNEYEALNIEINYTNSDYVWNMYPPGVSLLWIPMFTIANGLSYLLNFIPVIDIDTSGYTIIFQTSMALTGIFLGIFGLYLIYFLLRNYFGKHIALLTILSLHTTTNLLFYIAVEPINSHATSFFISSLFVYFFLLHQSDKYYYFVLGAIGGIAGLIRTQDLLILVLPIIQIINNDLITYHKTLTAGLNSKIRSVLYLFIGSVIAFSPQVYFWKKIFNTYIYSPYLNVGFDLFEPRFAETLFNLQNGLFTVTPIIAIAFTGLFFIKRKAKNVFFYALAYFFLQLFLVSSWNSPLGGSFSNRMMVSTYPLMAFGLAAIFNKLLEKFSEHKVILLIATFAIFNVFMIIRYLSLY